MPAVSDITSDLSGDNVPIPAIHTGNNRVLQYLEVFCYMSVYLWAIGWQGSESGVPFLIACIKPVTNHVESFLSGHAI